jgi:COP9 signalosome complex subunit 4
MATVVGRRVLGAYVSAMTGGSGMEKIKSNDGESEGDDVEWEKAGEKAFVGEEGGELRKGVVEGVLAGGAGGGWCDEQVS